MSLDSYTHLNLQGSVILLRLLERLNFLVTGSEVALQLRHQVTLHRVAVQQTLYVRLQPQDDLVLGNFLIQVLLLHRADGEIVLVRTNQ